jgi:hypothetical protein
MSLLKIESLIEILYAYSCIIIATTVPERVFNHAIPKAEAIPPRIGIATGKQHR